MPQQDPWSVASTQPVTAAPLGGAAPAPATGSQDPWAVVSHQPQTQQTLDPNQPGMQPEGSLKKAWDWFTNKPLLDNVLPDGAKSGDVLRGALFQHIYNEPYMPGINDFDTKAGQHADDSPTKAALRTGINGALRDSSDAATSFTTPAAISTMALGAASKAAPAASKTATALRGAVGAISAGFGAQGAKQVYDASTKDKDQSGNPIAPADRVQRGLFGAAMMSGGAAGVADAAPSIPRLPSYLSEKMAPATVEGALRVRATDRAHLADKNAIGRSVLDDLTANKPEDILQQANEKINEYGNQLDNLAEKSKAFVSLTPAFDALDQIEATAKAQNSAQELKIVQKIRTQLTKRAADGSPIPSEPTAREALDLKRGIGKLKNWGSPQEAALAGPIVERVYGAMDGALDKAIPGSQGVNQKLSALMRVADRAEDLTNLASPEQNAFARFGAHTGVMAAPVALGGSIGAALGGTPGAAIGSGIGFATLPFLQEAVASPGGRIRIARLMNRAGSPAGPAPTATPPRMAPGAISSSMAAQKKR